jgi:hypothetical protein
LPAAAAASAMPTGDPEPRGVATNQASMKRMPRSAAAVAAAAGAAASSDSGSRLGGDPTSMVGGADAALLLDAADAGPLPLQG